MYRAPLAALMLTLQGLTGGVVSLVHAAERTSAPAAIEAQHSARCPVLHDAVKCPQCQHAGAYAVVRHVRGLLPDASPAESYAALDRRAPAGTARRPAAHPRAPPHSLS